MERPQEEDRSSESNPDPNDPNPDPNDPVRQTKRRLTVPGTFGVVGTVQRTGTVQQIQA
jgi:hypothetical protein